MTRHLSVLGMIETGPPVQTEDIGRLEQVAGAILPPDYVQFLKTYNGGAPLYTRFRPRTLPRGSTITTS